MSLNFDTVLIANRGEIACRVMRSARTLGLKSVAVYSDADLGAAHVRMADAAIRLGPGPAAHSYLRADLVIEAALATGAGAIHPGYGFLSENADFAAAVAAAGLVFVGPTPEQLRVFGDKHTAREAARAVGVPLVPGSGILESAEHAVAEAERIGYPVMVKAVGGGGGIGMQACSDAAELRSAYERVQRLAAANFSSAGVFLERFVARARHVEVQVFGDGSGRVVSLGTRDCSLQRRNQKVIEEAPAPGLSEELTAELLATSRALGRSVGYRSAGTVEFVYDIDRGAASFLEMNTRLQVEHPVTEAVTGVDLVAWMLRLAGGDTGLLDGVPDSGPAPNGWAVEARVYAEDPVHDYRPSAGLVTSAVFPADARVDTWIDTGTEVSAFYDPLLAKVVTHGATREQALTKLTAALADTHVYGVQTNLPQLRAAATAPIVRAAEHSTGTLAELGWAGRRMDVLRAGTMTTVQDRPGRIGLWEVGIPPSGPMDDLSFALANTAVGNPDSAPGLECTLHGPRLRFSGAATICVTGAPAPVTVDGEPVPMWEPVALKSGAVLDIGAPADAGLRTYLAIRGGVDAPRYHGSASTFTLGGFGGVTGRAVADGDVLGIVAVPPDSAAPTSVPVAHRPDFTHNWQLAVGEGPQTAPAYFTDADMAQFYEQPWRVGGHANRTGIRLEGPKPEFSRTDGGDAGLHPSNLHDNPYSVGALNVSGDTPILLGPDGPSLGGFACPLTVVSAHRWKLGQLRPGDTVRFLPIDDQTAAALRGSTAARATGVLVEAVAAGGRTGPDRAEYIGGAECGGAVGASAVEGAAHGGTVGASAFEGAASGGAVGGSAILGAAPGDAVGASAIAGAAEGGTAGAPAIAGPAARVRSIAGAALRDRGILRSTAAGADRPSVAYLRGGDDNILVEYGERVLDLGLRMRVHALARALGEAAPRGIVDVTPGVRSLHIHFDPDELAQHRLLGLLAELEDDLPATGDLVVPSRTIRLPLSFDDPSIAEAIDRYRSGIRDTAPWLPSNVEFIRRVNGLDSVDDVRRVVFDAEYLVLGLGDVYLGAPLAVPLDPRHRLVTTKYNPARTWTPADAVGIGGKYLCVYGMASPGGYQLIGRTVPIWSSYRQHPPFENGTPWLFRFFDRIVWEPVTPEQLLEHRAAARAGRFDAEVGEGSFALADHRRMLAADAGGIAAFEARQSAAFEAEKRAWRAAGEFDRAVAAPPVAGAAADVLADLPPGATVVTAPMVGNVWRVDIEPGTRLAAGDPVAVLEAMKLELPIPSPATGTVLRVLAKPGATVEPGTPLAVIGVD
ncbi:5-oxoprolinase/urea amidolyase family protein [Nocardia sp. NPDC048505]|uniref:5-oxoprolinase/urea amidolyase family protein n=1 Tax=unclassified Nocardia TaxID=2637762 RepID=UPI0034054C81